MKERQGGVVGFVCVCVGGGLPQQRRAINDRTQASKERPRFPTNIVKRKKQREQQECAYTTAQEREDAQKNGNDSRAQE